MPLSVRSGPLTLCPLQSRRLFARERASISLTFLSGREQDPDSNSMTYMQPRLAPSTSELFIFIVISKPNVSFSTAQMLLSCYHFPISTPCYPTSPEDQILDNPSHLTSSATIPRSSVPATAPHNRFQTTAPCYRSLLLPPLLAARLPLLHPAP